MLADMGFTPAQARKALRETVRVPLLAFFLLFLFLFSASALWRELMLVLCCDVQAGDPERAVEWLFSHPDDTGADDPAPVTTTTSTSSASTAADQVIGPAKYVLKAFISHKGPSVHSGHYVAHVKKEGEGWVLFNDEKVVKADEESVRELKALAYLYLFERV